jgi:dipicolinate synthase subunit A
MTDWHALRIAVVAGDEREQEIARLAAAQGAQVRAFGFPWPPDGIDGVTAAASATEALAGADYALFPIPGIAADGSLFAPEHPDPIVVTEADLGGMAAGAAIILGIADERLRAAAAPHGIEFDEYEHDKELMMLRAPAIVEGALRAAVEHTDVTIHAADVVVVGFGSIGGLLAGTLRALGANVTVAARNPLQRAEAYAIGASPLPLAELADEAGRFQMLFSAVPAPVVGREVLERLPARSLVMDLAAPPGGVDLELARALGHRAVWARGLGRRAPVTVGQSQWAGIRRRIDQRESRKVST